MVESGLICWNGTPHLSAKKDFIIKTRKNSSIGKKSSVDMQDIDLDFLPTLPEYVLRRAYLAVNYTDVCALSEIGLRPIQAAALTVIGRNPGLTQSRVAEALRIQRSNFIPILNTLERKGLIRRTTSSSDQRAHALYLTPEGLEVMAETQRLSESHRKNLIGKIGNDDWEKLVDLLNKLVGSLADIPGHIDKLDE